jgi:hypothetical protein
MKSYLLTALGLLALSHFSYAAEREDYDLDDDGLIEIQDLHDLDDIRNNFTLVGDTSFSFAEIRGATLYGSNMGCPESGCQGYELVNDLNFDSNNNGQFDSADQFWNEGKGWDPIGNFGKKLVTEFNGNGHSIFNLTINRPGEPFMGMFAYAELAHLHDFTLTGNLVTGAESGGLLGYSWKTVFENIRLDLTIQGENAGAECQSKCEPHYLGGVVGIADESSFSQIIAKVKIAGLDRLGGLVGRALGDASSKITEVAVLADIDGDDYIGALAGDISNYDVQSVVSVSSIDGHQAVGGVFGNAERVVLNNALVSGHLNSTSGVQNYALGGSVLGSSDDTELANIVSLMRMPSLELDTLYSFGAITPSKTGLVYSANNIIWAADLTERTQMFGRHSQPGTERNFDLTDLQCANASDNCNGLTYSGFDNVNNSDEAPLWHFGSNLEAPMMVLSSFHFGDADGDGLVDQWPDMNIPMPTSDPEPASKTDDDSILGLGSLSYLLLLMSSLLLLPFRRIA